MRPVPHVTRHLTLVQPLLRCCVLPHSSQPGAIAASLPPQDIKVICDAECSAKLESAPEVSLPSGLKYREIAVGNGPTPPVGFQVGARGQGVVSASCLPARILSRGAELGCAELLLVSASCETVTSCQACEARQVWSLAPRGALALSVTQRIRMGPAALTA